MFWEEESALSIENGPMTELYSCNTQKDKDKRICRHSFGVLFGCSPCGVGKYLTFRNLCQSKFLLVTIFDELFRSENVKQVYGIVTDWMSTLEEKERRKIKYYPLNPKLKFAQNIFQVHII